MPKWLKVLVGFVLLLIISFVVLRQPDKSLDELVAEYTDQSSKWVEVSGMNVHYKEEGSGFPLLLIHGTGASLHTWDGWTDSLKKQFRVIRMDLPAYGLTGPAPDADYSINMYTDFIEAFVQKLDLDTFAIAGNSLGGNIAWSYTIDHPEKVKQLVLIDASGYPSNAPSNALVFKIASNPFLRPMLRHITPRSFIRKNLEQVYSNDHLISDALVKRYHDLALREGNRQAFIDRIASARVDNSSRIKEINCPALILWGAQDTWINPSYATKFNNDILKSEIMIYKELGHVPMEEDPRRTVEDVIDFLSKHQSD